MRAFEKSSNAMTILLTKERAVDLVFSPDDGGYYLHDYDLVSDKDRVSKKIWRVRADAERAFAAGKVTWER